MDAAMSAAIHAVGWRPSGAGDWPIFTDAPDTVVDALVAIVTCVALV